MRFHEKPAAVIGVTGRKQDVDKYGGILKKMTEILMLNIYYKQHFDLEERLRNHFLREWLNGKPLKTAHGSAFAVFYAANNISLLAHAHIIAICDIDNPLYDTNGSAAVFHRKNAQMPPACRHLMQRLKRGGLGRPAAGATECAVFGRRT